MKNIAKNAKKNIWQKCEGEHREHNLLIIKEIIPDKNELKKMEKN